MTLRVLHLMSCRGWSSDAYWAGRIAREQASRGYQVTFVARQGTERKVLSRLADLGVTDVQTMPFSGRREPHGLLRDVRRIAAWLPHHDIVHVHRGKEHWLAALAAVGSRARPPIVRTRHIVHPVRNHVLNRWLYRRATAHVVAVSGLIRDQYLMSRLLSAARVTALRGGVDAARFHPGVDGTAWRRELGIPAGAPLVGVLGGLRSMKGHAVFLTAARLLLARRPGVRFVLVGDGREAERLRALAQELGLGEAAMLVGAVPAPEIAVAAFDVAVYPSIASEGMGRVVFEYMAAGRPIVASRVGLASEVLEDGVNARLVAPGDAEGLAAAIERMLDDRDQARAFGAAARTLVEAHYAGPVVAEALERIYRRVLGTQRPPVR